MSSQKLQPGHLLTPQERRLIRDHVSELKKRIDGVTGPERIELERQLENVRMEQANDRACRPGKKAKNRSKAS